ncbi:MAG: penicillin-binding protein [Proteobacteria bacterium]|nr:MAG: penicillin-binding protein [Pseudomonadota bacterium]
MRSWPSRILLALVGCVVLVVAGAVGTALALYFAIVSDLPDLHGIEDYRPPLASTVFDRDGQPIGEFFDERRRLVRLEEIPEHVVLAFVAGEDDSFFQHSGIDWQSIVRAAWADIQAREIVQGGSTITQQTVKSLLLTPERRFDRKLKEMILARQLEQEFTKDEILALYLNQIYFGGGAWGIGEAARTYFGKHVGELTISEGAMLAGLPKAPSRFSPLGNYKAADVRRTYVLGRMRALGFVDEATYQRELAAAPAITGPRERADFAAATWFTEEVRRHLFERVGSDLVLRGGLRIETTLDLDLQRSAEKALRRGIESLDQRQGWRGPVRRVPRGEVAAEVRRVAAENGLDSEAQLTLASLDLAKPWLGVVTALDGPRHTARVSFAPGLAADVHLADVAWARERNLERESVPRTQISQVFAVGDVARFRVFEPEPEAKPAEPPEPDSESDVEPAEVAELPRAPASPERRVALYQSPEVEGAVVALDVSNGEVLALVGGYDYGRSQFDRAVQARRQPGSAFKPFVYATALTRGLTALSTVHDQPVSYTDPASGAVWAPQNYDHRMRGPVPMREALARSLNLATINLLFRVGIRSVVNLAHDVGISSHIVPYPSMALGTSPVTLVELTSAYAVFPAGGRRVDPIFIRRVVDRDGKVLLERFPIDRPIDEKPPTWESAKKTPKLTADGVAMGPDQVMTPSEAFLITDLLRAPVEHPGGTARKAQKLGRPLAGKTGTTDDHGDAWFVGFSADIAAGAWVGFDERRSLGKGETGGRAALPIWIEFMADAHADKPVRDFPVPEGVSYARVDPATGQLAGEASANSYMQAFPAGAEPSERAGGGDLSAGEERELLRMDF